ncbi:DDE-type integrase/transposase/recombinase [Flavobacterium sp. KJJ]|uniref:DDE-type integrase/transposase/recombinase n=1 Tax=Flavobacterium sp. KJJ TaxID=1270193 RepID=UPI0009E70D25
MKKRKAECGLVRDWMRPISKLGIWCYLYRAVDKLGDTVDFLLTRRRQRMSAQSFVIKGIKNNFRPTIINIDKSGSNTIAKRVNNKRSFCDIKIRQCNT